MSFFVASFFGRLKPAALLHGASWREEVGRHLNGEPPSTGHAVDKRHERSDCPWRKKIVNAEERPEKGTYVASADARPLGLDNHVVRPLELGDRPLLVCEGELLTEDEAGVL